MTENFPTPRHQDSYERANWKTIEAANRGDADLTLSRKVKYEAGKGNGQLNPTWVEWLMGFPLGWTDLPPSGTRSSRRSRSGSAGESSTTKGGQRDS